ncbi:hypothetical protein [Ochrobactrum vermis]|uniref:hypothetical protein n=1 Tax=Ochrobactrum vermis TaxID=1827297 RepID=UPI000D442249|nr:hypothetical protein [Ochrobactrum vermis]PQZ24314.1 hypothetical protein CQZ93_25015 [Ochrobactrum vermis]
MAATGVGVGQVTTITILLTLGLVPLQVAVLGLFKSMSHGERWLIEFGWIVAMLTGLLLANHQLGPNLILDLYCTISSSRTARGCTSCGSTRR